MDPKLRPHLNPPPHSPSWADAGTNEPRSSSCPVRGSQLRSEAHAGEVGMLFLFLQVLFCFSLKKNKKLLQAGMSISSESFHLLSDGPYVSGTLCL